MTHTKFKVWVRGRVWAAFATLAIVLVPLLGCENSPASGTNSASSARAAASVSEDKLVVFAAASLRDAFTALSEEFKRTHPGVEIVFNFAGTQELRTQVEQGAAADVFASADPKHMAELVKGGHAAAAMVFVSNEPVLVVAKEGVPAIKSFAELPNLERLVIGTPEVPIGRYTLQILDKASASLGADFRARVEANVVSRELNVKQVLSKVTLGEAQAAFVYRTDAQAVLDRVNLVPIPDEFNVVADYPIAVVSGTVHPTLARDWVSLMLSSSGQQVFAKAGFIPRTSAAP
jgi:molybdate transport system substrate-binding protein